MNCPVDNIDLIHRPGGRFGLHSCHRCSGIWVKLADFKGLLPVRLTGEPPHRRAATARYCPNCNLRMELWLRHDIEVDVCRACEGIWFDKGELEKMARARPATGVKVNDRSDGLAWLDVVDVVPGDAVWSGVSELGRTVGSVIEAAPEAAETAAAGVLEVLGAIF